MKKGEEVEEKGKRDTYLMKCSSKRIQGKHIKCKMGKGLMTKHTTEEKKINKRKIENGGRKSSTKEGKRSRKQKDRRQKKCKMGKCSMTKHTTRKK